MKVLLALESNIDSLWFVRCSHPLESLCVVIADLSDRPNDSVNFSGIDTNIHYTKCPKIDYLGGDLRKSLLPATFDVLDKIQVIWPLCVRELFEKIAKSYESQHSKRFKDGKVMYSIDIIQPSFFTFMIFKDLALRYTYLTATIPS